MSKAFLFFNIFLLAGLSCGNKSSDLDGGDIPSNVTTYRNPVLNKNTPDPSVIKSNDGYFYLYSTQDNLRGDTLYIPIHRSKDLIKWDYVGTVFNAANRPRWVSGARLWAPDINYVNGKYILYYSMGIWDGTYDSAIGVAIADDPAGPFVDNGRIVDYTTQGVNNSIDQFYIEDSGRKYLVWGSFHGIYAIELSADGLAVRDGALKVQLAANQIEGSYICKRGEYFYLIGSAGSCCVGASSTYHLVFGRSKNVLGPYVTKEGKRMLDGAGDLLLQGNNTWAGPGHNAEFVQDDNGSDWILYHSYEKTNPNAGRLLLLDQVYWNEWGPYLKGNTASVSAKPPVFKK